MKLLVIIGPSGSGKSTAMRELQRRGLIAVTPSWTTRPQRADESQATVEHRFVDDHEFDRLQGDGFFLEVITLFGFRYGLPPVEQPSAGVIPTIMMRSPRLNLVDKHYPDHIVYQIEAPFEDARARVLAAGQIAEDDIRLSGWEEERALGAQLADRVIRSSGPVSNLIETLEQALVEDFPTQRGAR